MNPLPDQNASASRKKLLTGVIALFLAGFAYNQAYQARMRSALPSPDKSAQGPLEVKASVDPSALFRSTSPMIAVSPLIVPSVELSTDSLPWEVRVDEIKKAAPNSHSAAVALFKALPQFPDLALDAVLDFALEHLMEADYVSVVAPVLLDRQNHGRILSILFADLMERAESVSLPILLAIARDSGHAFEPYALDNLRLLLGEDFASDWGQWESAIRKKVATESNDQ